MPTVIKIQTFMCPLGVGDPNGPCRFHVAVDNIPLDNKCPDHRLDLVKTTHPDDQITVTITDEAEVDKRDIPNEEKHKLKEKIKQDIEKFRTLEHK